jgi:hypothetical protein
MRTPSQLISDCYLAFTAASSHQQDNWLCDETWVRLLIAHYPNLKKTCSLTRMLVTRAITKKAGPFTGPNEFAIFVKQFRTECPYSGERRRVSYFYRQVNGKPPADPVFALDIYDVLAKYNHLQRDGDCIRIGRSSTNTPTSHIEGHDQTGIGGGDPPLDGNTPKRTHTSNNNNDLGVTITPCRDQQVGVVAASGDKVVGTQHGSDAGLDVPIYWESLEAAKLFAFDYKNRDDVFDVRKARIKILTEVLRPSDAYKRVVTNSEENLLPEQIFHIRNKCLFLHTAYVIAYS